MAPCLSGDRTADLDDHNCLVPCVSFLYLSTTAFYSATLLYHSRKTSYHCYTTTATVALVICERLIKSQTLIIVSMPCPSELWDSAVTGSERVITTVTQLGFDM